MMRRRREERTDAVIEMPFGEPHVEVECPECEESFLNTIAATAEYSPTFGPCPNWECDAFLKFQSDGSEETAAEASGPEQTGLDQFSGGVSA